MADLVDPEDPLHSALDDRPIPVQVMVKLSAVDGKLDPMLNLLEDQARRVARLEEIIVPRTEFDAMRADLNSLRAVVVPRSELTAFATDHARISERVAVNSGILETLRGDVTNHATALATLQTQADQNKGMIRILVLVAGLVGPAVGFIMDRLSSFIHILGGPQL